MHSFELRPNCSLTPRTATLFFLGTLVISLGIAGSFAAAGYWPILPFAGLEMLALGLALRWSMRRDRLREVISVDERHVRVRKTSVNRQRDYEFSRPWTRVELMQPPTPHWPTRLLLRSMGRSVEVGAFLTDHERDGLKRRLTEVIDRR